MLYIKCPSCKNLLGNKEIPFREEFDKICNNDKLTDEQKKEQITKIYPKIGVTDYCCKMRLATYFDQIEIVK